MENTDKQESSNEFSEEDIFLSEVVKDEADLLYLDSFLREVLCKR